MNHFLLASPTQRDHLSTNVSAEWCTRQRTRCRNCLHHSVVPTVSIDAIDLECCIVTVDGDQSWFTYTCSSMSFYLMTQQLPACGAHGPPPIYPQSWSRLRVEILAATDKSSRFACTIQTVLTQLLDRQKQRPLHCAAHGRLRAHLAAVCTSLCLQPVELNFRQL